MNLRYHNCSLILSAKVALVGVAVCARFPIPVLETHQ